MPEEKNRNSNAVWNPKNNSGSPVDAVAANEGNKEKQKVWSQERRTGNRILKTSRMG